MTNDLRDTEAPLRGAVSGRIVGVTFIMAALLFLLTALSGARPVGAATGQASSGTATQTMATVPAGTRLMVKMADSVDSETNQQTDVFRGSLEANLMAGDLVVAPEGRT